MTPVGKILVFFNLIFSLVVGAMGIMVFKADTEKNLELSKALKERDVLKASTKTYQEEKEVLLAGQAAESNTLKETVKDLNTKVGDRDKRTGELNSKIKDINKAMDEKDTVLKATVDENKRRQDQNDEMRKILQSEVDRNVKLTKDLEKTRSAEIANGIAVNTLKSINERIEAQLRDMARDMEKAKAGKTVAQGIKSSNPPPDNIEGLVKVADPTGLVKISVGSDAGLARGHTLEIYRLSAVASQSKYLGTIRILEVTPHEAVGQPVRPLADKAREGDRVASRILGN
ncbi:MAG: hypothetical protein EXR99_09375 [Gemmataceae bacterium]|nr:hypothetical protein [Gemmataceae bacterium]